jgi:serine/threonine protein kinase
MSMSKKKIRIPKNDGASSLYNVTYDSERFLADLTGIRIGERIGSGYFGAVHSGWFKEQFVAIKLLCKESEKLTKDEYQEFIQEGKLMLCVSPCDGFFSLLRELKTHEHVIKVLAISISEENPAIIMEHADKGTLKAYLRNLDEDLPLQVVFELIIGMAKGIRSLHKQDIVHRDIAARNVLVCTPFSG